MLAGKDLVGKNKGNKSDPYCEVSENRLSRPRRVIIGVLCTPIAITVLVSVLFEELSCDIIHVHREQRLIHEKLLDRTMMFDSIFKHAHRIEMCHCTK